MDTLQYTWIVELMPNAKIACPQCGNKFGAYKPTVFSEPSLSSKNKKVFRCTNYIQHEPQEEIVWSYEIHQVPDSFSAVRIFAVHNKKPRNSE